MASWQDSPFGSDSGGGQQQTASTPYQVGANPLNDINNFGKAQRLMDKLWRKSYKGKNTGNLTEKLQKDKFGLSPELLFDLQQDAFNAAGDKNNTINMASNPWQTRGQDALRSGGFQRDANNQIMRDENGNPLRTDAWQYSNMFASDTDPGAGQLGSGGTLDNEGLDIFEPGTTNQDILGFAQTTNDIGIPIPSYLDNDKMGEDKMRAAIMEDRWNTTMLDQINKNKGAAMLQAGYDEYEADPINAALTRQATDLIQNPFSMSDADFEATLAAGEEPLIGAEASAQRAIAENMAGRGMDPNSPLAAALSSNMRFKRLQGQGDVRRQAGLDRATRKRQELLQALQAAGALSGQQQGVKANYRGNIANILGGMGANSVTAGLESWPGEMFQQDMAERQMKLAEQEAGFGLEDAIGTVAGLGASAMTGGTTSIVGNLLGMK